MKIWAGGIAQVVECLPSKHEAKFKPQSHPKKKLKGWGFGQW
jgi:hypothetical protein